MTAPSDSLRWGRALLAGLLAELALLIVTVPFFFAANGQTILQFVVPPASFLALFAAGWWTARKAQSLFLLHGLLAGVGAIFVYILMALAATQAPDMPASATFSPAYLLAHAFKLLGGAIGAMAARRRAAWLGR